LKRLFVLLLLLLLVSGCCKSDVNESNSPGSNQPSTPIGSLSVHFIDVGQGDSILIDLEETEILIDGGGRSPGVTANISDYVDGMLEVVISTHPHADHIGGLIEVFQSFTVEQYWSSGDTSTSQTYSDLMTAIPESCHQVVITRGDSPSFGELSFEVLHPDSLSGTTNNSSIVHNLSYGDVNFLFAGDAEEEAEASMIIAGILSDIDILKVGHHGSHSSSTNQFVNVIQPEIAIYMAGTGNSYGHPHDETIETLCDIEADIYGTDTHGTVIITVDGGIYTVQPENQIEPVDCSPPPPIPPPTLPPPPPLPAVTNIQITYNILLTAVRPPRISIPVACSP